MIDSLCAAASRSVAIVKKTRFYRELHATLLSRDPIEAWSEDGQLGFVAFSLWPVEALNNTDQMEYRGGVAVFAVDLNQDRVICARTARMDSLGSIAAVETMYEAEHFPDRTVAITSKDR